MTFQDTLTTILELRGLQTFINGMQGAAKQAQLFQAANQPLASGLLGAAGAVAKFALANADMLLGLGALLTLMDTTSRAFGKMETDLLRLGLLLQNQGRNVPLAELQGWANHIQDVTGVTNTHTLALMRQAAAIGFNMERTKQLVGATLNLEAAGNQANLIDTVQKALEFPGSRSLRPLALQLKIDPRFLTGQMEHDIDYINQQIAQKYGGIAQIMKLSTEGVLNSVSSDFQRLMQDWGDFWAPLFKTLLVIVDGFIKALTWVSEQVNYFLNHNWFSAVTHTASGGDQRLLNARAAEGGRPRDDSDHLQQIAQNTHATAQAVVAATFGNISAFTRQGATFGALNAALATRG